MAGREAPYDLPLLQDLVRECVPLAGREAAPTDPGVRLPPPDGRGA